MSAPRKSRTQSTRIKDWLTPRFLRIDRLPQVTSDRIAYGLIIFSYISYVLWALLSNGTWDEDCPTRYFNALIAFKQPQHFVMLWNRPLWMLIFAAPVHISKVTIPLIMSAIAAGSAYALYKTSKIDKMQFAFLVIPFLMFQPYFFGTARDAMTEPLAAAIIAFSYLAMKKERWLAFALLGALLPLARTELAVHLVFWVIPLMRMRKWKLIPLLGAGVVVWWVAAGIITGDWLFIYNQTLGSDLKVNRYGQQPFDTYINRFYYIIGPVVFFYLVMGLIRGIQNRSFKLFLDFQLFFGLCMYTLFAWKIVIGQSAGFLRNLIPLSPLIALIALRGYDFWVQQCFNKSKLYAFLGALISTLLVLIFYKTKLRIHHVQTEDIGYLHLSFFFAVIVLTFVPWQLFARKSKELRMWVGVTISAIVGLMAVSFTMISEPPDANMNQERYMLNRTVEVYESTSLKDSPKVYCSHNWFYWAAGVDRNKPRFSQIWQDSIDKAPDESLVIWEGHFSNRIQGDVPLEYFLNPQNGYAFVASVFSPDYSKNCILFVKKKQGLTDLDYLNRLTQSNPKVIEGFLRKADYYTEQGQTDNADEIANYAMQLKPDDAIVKFTKANVLAKQRKTAEALALYDSIKDELSTYLAWYGQKGLAYFNAGDYQNAKQAFLEGVEQAPDNAEMNCNVGICMVLLKEQDEGCQYLRKANELGYANAAQLIAEYCQ